MHVILVRHAQPLAEINADRVADPGLSDLGRWQAERLRRWLAVESIDAVVTSPKRRAIETVEGFIADDGLPHRVVDELDEIDRGAFVYHPTERLAADGGDYWMAVQEQRWTDIGWDSPEEFAARVAQGWDRIVADPPGQRVLVSCHGGTIRFLLGHVLGLSGRYHFTTDYAGITRLVVDVDAGRVTIASTNETGHFDAERRILNGVMAPSLFTDEPRRPGPRGG